MSVMRTKSVEQSISETDDPEFALKKSLSWLDLTVFGIGVIIGAGIFTFTGKAAQAYAGPAFRAVSGLFQAVSVVHNSWMSAASSNQSCQR